MSLEAILLNLARNSGLSSNLATSIVMSAGPLITSTVRSRSLSPEVELNDKMCCFPACRGERYFVLVDCMV